MATPDEILDANPCWCGRPAVEVVSKADSDHPEVRTQGYCERHCQQTTVIRERQEAP